jgi:hypothetical protein
LYVWSTINTAWGESTPSTVQSFTTNAANQSININWTAPSSAYFKKLSLYWNSTNNVSTATLLTEVQAGFSNSFTLFGPYVAYNTKNPPTYNTAFSGYWAGGFWQSV